MMMTTNIVLSETRVHHWLEGQPGPFISLRLAMILVFHCKVRWREKGRHSKDDEDDDDDDDKQVVVLDEKPAFKTLLPASLPLQSKLSLSLSQSLSRLGFLFWTAANATGRNQFVSFYLYSAPTFILSHELDFKKNALNLIEGNRSMIRKRSWFLNHVRKL